MPSIAEIRSAIADRDAEMRELSRREPLIPREMVLPPGHPALGMASVITGPRRAGKSVCSYQTASRFDRFVYVNFEDERLEMPGTELNKVLEAAHGFRGKFDTLVLDEIQNIRGWERFVARIVPTIRVIVTGSNARLMSRELATFLTGRHMDHRLFPFSFREFLVRKGSPVAREDLAVTRTRAETYRSLEEYLKIGGFPQASTAGAPYLAELYRDVLERDIVSRYRVRDISKLREVARFLVSNYAAEITYQRLNHAFEVRGTHTVANWMRYLESAYLLFELNRFSYQLKEQFRAPRKLYCIDTGMVNAVAFASSSNAGRLLENLVAVELQRRRSYWEPDLEVFYWKDHGQREVDFVLKQGRAVRQLLQVTRISDRLELDPRELEALTRAGEALRCDRLTVLTWDLEDELRSDGKRIELRPVVDWLLDVPGGRSRKRPPSTAGPHPAREEPLPLGPAPAGRKVPAGQETHRALWPLLQCGPTKPS